MKYMNQVATCLGIVAMAACSSTKNTAKVDNAPAKKGNDICAHVTYSTDTPHISWKEE